MILITTQDICCVECRRRRSTANHSLPSSQSSRRVTRSVSVWRHSATAAGVVWSISWCCWLLCPPVSLRTWHTKKWRYLLVFM